MHFMKKLILIKIGGSVITEIHKPNTAKMKEIRRLLSEIKRAGEAYKIILGHGGGSFPHIPALKYKTHLGIINKTSLIGAYLTQYAASTLDRIVLNQARSVGLKPLSFSPSAGALTKSGRIISWDVRNMFHALRNGFLPVTYGDVTIDVKQGVAIVSTEEILRHIATKVRPEKVIIGGDTEGVFTSDPKTDRNARLIREIDKSNIEIAMRGAGATTKIDVTGGMRSKLKYAYEISKTAETTCQIINAAVPGRLYSAIRGENVIGTTVTA